MSKIFFIAVIGILFMTTVAGFALYVSESEKNRLQRTEILKTSEEAQEEVKKLKSEVKKEKESGQEDKQKVLDQITAFSQEKDAALKDVERFKKELEQERSFSVNTNEDISKLRQAIARLRSQNKGGIAELEELFKKKLRSYEARILSLEAQLAKSKDRFTQEADRYHYNLGVIYTQTKDFEQAVREYKKAIEFNPRNAKAHYNLGIIYDDYFKDKANAKVHYRDFLSLDPISDDADTVREWLANLGSGQ
jgi:tetratricopeptide (TPR) repeat protein